MREVRRVLLALLIALVFSLPAAAQSDDSRVSLNAAVGPSFANVGTTFSTIAGVDLKLDQTSDLLLRCHDFSLSVRTPRAGHSPAGSGGSGLRWSCRALSAQPVNDNGCSRPLLVE